jgi:F0F1-type ATP synthase assembly protein I
MPPVLVPSGQVIEDVADCPQPEFGETLRKAGSDAFEELGFGIERAVVHGHWLRRSRGTLRSMPEGPPDEPTDATEEQLELRLRKLLGEADKADPDELDEIELKLKDLDDRLSASQDTRKSADALFDAEFEERLQRLHEKADRVKEIKESAERDKRRSYAVERSSARGLGIGLTIAYAIVGLPLIGVGIGWLIDKNLGTTMGKGVGVVAGVAIGMVVALALLKRTNDSE